MNFKKTRVFAAFIATLLAGTVALTACSPKPSTDNSSSNNEQSSQAEASGTSFEFTSKMSNTVDIGTPSKPIDAEEVYKKLTYIPEMFCTKFDITGSENDVKKTVVDTGYYQYNEKASGGGGVERQITNLPYSLEVKKRDFSDPKVGKTIKYIATAKFYDAKEEKTYKDFLFTIDQHTISLKEIKNIKTTDNLVAEFEEAQLELKYNFTYKGNVLTLEKDGNSVTMHNDYIDPKKDKSPSISCNGFLAKGSPVVDHIAGIYMQCNEKNSSFSVTFINDKNEDETSYYAHGELKDNGLFTFSVPYATETKTYQFVCFYLNSNGFILTDGTTNYKYTSRQSEFLKYKLSAVLGDDASAESISAEKQKELTIAQNSILTELEKAFASKNIKANVDKATGRVSLDSNILFATDSSDLSDEGKKSLDDFLDVYTSVVLNDKNKNLVANIIVEGHTDTNGEHDYNQTLSEKRADAVAKYCTDKVAALKNIIKSKGYSYDKPVYKDDGSIDMDASRRVEFKFTLDKK